jgi:hypothetical protein
VFLGFFDFHGDNGGANPPGDANQIQELPDTGSSFRLSIRLRMFSFLMIYQADPRRSTTVTLWLCFGVRGLHGPAAGRVLAPFTSLKYPVRKETIIVIKSGETEEKYLAHFFALFADVPVSDLLTFAEKYDISISAIKKYYLKYVQKFYSSHELEDVFALK